jgi:hypothetical protein
MDTTQSDNIITLLGLEDLPLENRAQLVDELSQILEVRVLNSAYDTLSEAQAAELDAYISDDKPEKVSEFIQQNVPALNEIFAHHIESLKQELVDYKAEMKQKMEQELSQKD